MSLTERIKPNILTIAILLLSTGQLGVTIFLPVLPSMANTLSVNQSQIQWLITIYLAAFGLSQLFYGPLSDAKGRKPLFLCGQGLYLIGTFVCLLGLGSFNILVIGRLLQGLGGGSASVLSRSIVKDTYQSKALAKAISYLGMSAAIVPMLGPVIGGWIAWHLNWKCTFDAVFIYVLFVMALGYFCLPETLPRKSSKLKTAAIFRTYWDLVKQPQVTLHASFCWITYLCMVVSISLFPFFIQKDFGLSTSQYGNVMMIPSSGILIGSFLFNKLNQKISDSQLMLFGLSLVFISGCLLILASFTLINLIVAFSIFMVGFGIIFSLGFVLLIKPHNKSAGSVIALSGAVQMLLSGMLSGILIQYLVRRQTSLGIFYLSAVTFLLIAMFMLHRSQQFSS